METARNPQCVWFDVYRRHLYDVDPRTPVGITLIWGTGWDNPHIGFQPSDGHRHRRTVTRIMPISIIEYDGMVRHKISYVALEVAGMFESLVKSIENTFVEFTPRRFLYVLFLIGLVAGALVVFNELTGYGYNQRIESRISALERLHALERDGIVESEELSPLYESLVRDLKERPFRPFSFGINFELILRILSAAGLPIALTIAGAWQTVRGDPQGDQLFIGALVMTAILVVPAVYLPTFTSIWVNVVSYAAVQVGFLYLLNRVFGEQSKSAT